MLCGLFLGGIFSGKFRKLKLFVLVGYSLSNAVKPLFVVARAPFDLLLIRVSDRFGNGVRASPLGDHLFEM